MNVSAMCTSFKKELLSGLHALGTSVVRASTAPDVLKAALYLVSASLSAATAAYSATGEVVGTNYNAGGVVVTNADEPAQDGTTGFWTPSGDFEFENVTITTPFDAVLLYNATQGNKAITVTNFGAQSITAGNFVLHMPANDALNAAVRVE